MRWIETRLSAGAVALLMDIPEARVMEQRVPIIPENTELATVPATDVNGSRPFPIKLLHEERIPQCTVGRHHRIRMEDVLACGTPSDSERESVLGQLAAEAHEEDMGHDKP